MSRRLVFLLEEDSMKEFLDALMTRLHPEVPFLCVSHEGKQDLRKSIPRKLKAWMNPRDRFIILHDKDSADCRKLKSDLVELCQGAGGREVVVRIVCHELESWYIGDPKALAEAYGDAALVRAFAKPRFADPDAIRNPSQELQKRIPRFQKREAARLMGSLVDRDRNASRSFRVLLDSIDAFAGRLSE